MMMVTRDSDGNFPAWYVPKARFGGFEEWLLEKCFQLYNIYGSNVWVIDEADKKLSNPASYPIEGRPTLNFLFDPVTGHYSLLDNLQAIGFSTVKLHVTLIVSTSETGDDEGKTGTPETTDIVMLLLYLDKRLFFDEYLEWLKTAHPEGINSK